MEVIVIFRWFTAMACLALSASATDTRQETKCEERIKADMYILCDSSGSIHPTGWTKALTFISNLTKDFPLGPNGVQVAFGIFSSNFVHQFDLNTYTDHGQLSEAVQNTQQLKGSTRTFDALNAISTQGYLTSTRHGSRQGVDKTLVVITDGQSDNFNKTVTAAKNLRQQGIITICVGVGNADENEIQEIAGSRQNVFSVRSFGAIDSIRTQITQRICTVSSPPTSTVSPDVWVDIFFVVVTDGTVGLDNYQRYFDFIEKVISNFHISDNRTRVAIVADALENTGLLGDMVAIKKRLEVARSQNGYYGFGDGLEMALRHYYSTGRLNAHCDVVVLTDGKLPLDDYAMDRANVMKLCAMSIFTVSMKPVYDVKLLQTMACKPEYSFVADNYTALVDPADVISKHIYDGAVCSTVVPIDIMFTVDCSSETFRLCFDQAVAVVETVNITDEGNRAGFVTHEVLNRKAPLGNKTSVIQVFKTLKVGARYADYARYRLLEQVRKAALFINITRPTARRVIVYVTNDKSPNFENDLRLAQRLKDSGSIIFTLAVTSEADQNEMNAFATTPEYNLSSGNFSILNEVLGNLKQRGCREPE